MGDGGPGRPRVLHRKHIIELPEDLDLEKLLGLHESAGIVKAYLGTNVGAASATIAVVLGLLSFPPTSRLIASYIAFIRLQIAQVAHDIQAEFIPTPEEVVEQIVEGGKEAAETLAELFRRLEEEARRRLEENPPTESIEEGGEAVAGWLETIIQGLINAGEALGGRRYDPRKDPFIDPGD